jgi:hypothetical protein
VTTPPRQVLPGGAGSTSSTSTQRGFSEPWSRLRAVGRRRRSGWHSGRWAHPERMAGRGAPADHRDDRQRPVRRPRSLSGRRDGRLPEQAGAAGGSARGIVPWREGRSAGTGVGAGDQDTRSRGIKPWGTSSRRSRSLMSVPGARSMRYNHGSPRSGNAPRKSLRNQVFELVPAVR